MLETCMTFFLRFFKNINRIFAFKILFATQFVNFETFYQCNVFVYHSVFVWNIWGQSGWPRTKSVIASNHILYIYQLFISLIFWCYKNYENFMHFSILHSYIVRFLPFYIVDAHNPHSQNTHSVYTFLFIVTLPNMVMISPTIF